MFLLDFPQSLWFIFSFLSFPPCDLFCFSFTCAHPGFSNVNTLNPSSPLGTVILILNFTICLSFFLSLSLSHSLTLPPSLSLTHTTRAIFKFLAICFGNRTRIFWKTKQSAFFLAWISNSNVSNELVEDWKRYLREKRFSGRHKCSFLPCVENTQCPPHSHSLHLLSPIHPVSFG